MIRTFLIPLLAIVGLVFAMVTVVKGSKPPPAQPPAVPPPRAPFAAFVAGAGIIEASTENIEIGAPVGAIVSKVAAEVGRSVKAGEVLFELDARELTAELALRAAAAEVAQRQLARLRAGTRPELLPAARAKVAEAQATLADMQAQLEMWQKVADPRAVSSDDLSRRRFAVATAQARADAAQADLALLDAGTWSADLAVAEAQVAQAQASVGATRTEIDRRVVRAPCDARVLQSTVRAGQFAPAGALSKPLMVLGAVTPLHVRVDVDEHEAWRVRSGAKAFAYARGNRDIATALEFVRFEPLIVPKRSLTGDSSERVDTRVLQVLFAFDGKDLPLYVGQQVDVFIEASPLAGPASPTK